jgi:hypothetical protein
MNDTWLVALPLASFFALAAMVFWIIYKRWLPIIDIELISKRQAVFFIRAFIFLAGLTLLVALVMSWKA